MNILKYKYKAHKLVNLIFYFIVFFTGFILGFVSNKIDIKKMLSEFLMIDNVSALTKVKSGTISISDSSLKVTSSNFKNEEYIYKLFNYVVESVGLDISFNDFSNVFGFNYNNSSESSYYFSTSDWYWYSNNSSNKYSKTKGDVFYLHFINSSSFDYYYGTNDDSSDYSTSLSGGSRYYVFSTHDFSGSTGFLKVLDFSSYMALEFNENLFENNEDFKKVCVESGKAFSITNNTMSDVNSSYDFDYIWFPYNLNGLYKFLYDSSVEDHEVHYTEEEAQERYFFNTRESINTFYSSDIPGSYLALKGYNDKYSYYGWSAWPFRMYYDDDNSNVQFTIFELKEPTKIFVGNLSNDGNVHGGGGRVHLDGDEEITINDSYCFYIKNIYEVTYVNFDEWNDLYGIVSTPNGEYDFNTSFYRNNSNTSSFLSQPLNFITEMKDTINFINSLIYDFYLSLPVLLRAFLITLVIILLIMLLMRIGGYY